MPVLGITETVKVLGVVVGRDELPLKPTLELDQRQGLLVGATVPIDNGFV